MGRQLLLSLPHVPRETAWPEPREPKLRGRLGIIRWYGPCGAELHDSHTIMVLEAQRAANRLLGVDLSRFEAKPKKRRKKQRTRELGSGAEPGTGT